MNISSRTGSVRERLKLDVRRSLMRADLDIGRTPFARQVTRALAAHRIDSVLDVGANVGQYAALLRASGFTGRIVSLEPLPDAFARLQRRQRRDQSWSSENVAAGAAIGTATIHRAANSYSSSLLPPAAAQLAADPNARTVEELSIEVTTVSDVCSRHGLDPTRMLLKLDTQGYESTVLDGASDLLDRVAAVQLELSHVAMYDGQASAESLTQRMTEVGLTPWTWEAGVCSAQGQLLQSDVLFVRR